ncbi:hypothetical protein EG328_010604 [Venturia inaequalis]|nr:hypothetical protein EG328_010604 [Venturia inaequalis]RDI76329.1 hypothetical protein Vi05172_g13660 [Venturia inaequalis]
MRRQAKAPSTSNVSAFEDSILNLNITVDEQTATIDRLTHEHAELVDATKAHAKAACTTIYEMADLHANLVAPRLNASNYTSSSSDQHQRRRGQVLHQRSNQSPQMREGSNRPAARDERTAHRSGDECYQGPQTSW